MKKRISNATFLGIVGIGIFAIIMIFVVFPVGNIFIPTPINKAAQSNISPNVKNGTVPSNTFINTTQTFFKAPSFNSSAIQNALDSAGCTTNTGICALSSPKFLIDVQSVLFDSNGIQYPSSTQINIPSNSLIPASWIPSTINSLISPSIPAVTPLGIFLQNVPKLTLTDTQGHLLDLGTIQVGFYGVVPSDTTVVTFGQYAVYLDDQLRQQGSFGGQGTTTNKNIALQIAGLPALTFTFASDPQVSTWVNGTDHIYRIVIGNVTATTGTGQNTQTFQLTKTNIAYILVMTINNAKKTIIGAGNQAISVPLNDDTISACGMNSAYEQQYDNFFKIAGTENTPFVSVSDNGFQIIQPFQSNAIDPGTQIEANGYIGFGAGSSTCVTKTGIPRDTPIVITVGSQEYNVMTPATTYNYKYSCYAVYSGSPNESTLPTVTPTCTNNFGGN